jgi:hypothetical protein
VQPTAAEKAGQLGFDVEVDTPAAGVVADRTSPLIDEVLASPIYEAQRSRYGARAAEDDVVRRVLAVLASAGGRMHRDSVAAAAGIPAARMTGMLTVLRRQLNVEGYDVLALDPDQVTVLLDLTLLREQFLTGAES